MDFETMDYSLPLGGHFDIKGDLKTDLMLMALIVKSLDIIEVSGSPDYNGIKNMYFDQLEKLKVSVRQKLPKTTNNKSNDEDKKMSDEDKKFVVDTLMDIITGKDGNITAWTGTPAFSNLFKDVFSAAAAAKDWELPDDEDDDAFF